MIENITETIRAAEPPGTKKAQATPSRMAGSSFLGGTWKDFIDEHEYVAELRWPQSVRAFNIMRTDSQLSALYTAVTMPIRRFKWLVNENGAEEEVVVGISDDLGIDIQGQEPRPRGRMKGRFSHDKSLYHAFLAGIYGHMFMEQQGDLDDSLRWRLRKLFPIMPDTINKISVAPDGGLESITQRFARGLAAQPEPIPVTQLVGFIMDQEGANWVGRSWFRDCYKNYLVKDRLVRVDAINHERAGGIHIAKAPIGASPADIEALGKMAAAAKVGEDAGGALPAGSEYDIKKAGSGTDVIGSVRYHDEAMARRFLAMFLQLGQTETGSRALGQTFVDYLFLMQKTHAKWYIDVMNEHVVEDWVDWNYGESYQVPLLTYVIEEEDEYLAVEDLAMLVEKGIVVVDEKLEQQIRHRFRLAGKAQPQAIRDADPLPSTGDEAIDQLVRAAALHQYQQLHEVIMRYRDEHGLDADEAVKEIEKEQKRNIASLFASLGSVFKRG